MTAQGIGAALSTALAGFVVVQAGYSAAFLTLAAVAAAGLMVFLFAMPETKPRQESLSSDQKPERAAEDPVAARRSAAG